MDRHEQYIEKHYDEFQALRDLLITLSKSDPPGDLSKSSVNRAIFDKGNFSIKHGRTQEGRFANIREYALFTDMVRTEKLSIYEKLLPALWVSADGEYLIMPSWERMRVELIQPDMGYPKFLPRRVYGNLVLFMDQPVMLDYFAYDPDFAMEPIPRPTPPCSAYEENMKLTIGEKIKDFVSTATHVNDISVSFTRKDDHVKETGKNYPGNYPLVMVQRAPDPLPSWEDTPSWVLYRVHTKQFNYWSDRHPLDWGLWDAFIYEKRPTK